MRIAIVRRALALALLALAGVSAAMAATTTQGGTVKAAQNSKYGSLLVSSAGLTLYHITTEHRGTIKCTGACAKFWPPLLVTGNPKAGAGVAASKLGTIKRPGGGTQVTYNGYALYRYADDKKPGDVKGQGESKIWFAVTSAGKLAKGAASTGTTTTTPATTTTTTSGGGGYGYKGKNQ